jgi:hypothetical protein
MTALVVSVVLVTVMSTSAADSTTRRPSAHENSQPPQAAAAQTDADTIRQRVKEGQKVRITDDQGNEWHGRIGTLTPDKLTLATSDRQQRDVPYGTILRIDRPHDGLANGALIGFASGAALGFFAVLAEEARDCGPYAFFDCGDPSGAAYVAVPLVIGGLGAAVGVGIDALIRRDPNLFRRGSASRLTIAPAVGRGMRGFSVSVRW